MVYWQGPLCGGICSQQSMSPRGLVPLLVLSGPLHILVGAGSQGYGNRQVSREPDGLRPWGLGSKWKVKRKQANLESWEVTTEQKEGGLLRMSPLEASASAIYIRCG